MTRRYYVADNHWSDKYQIGFINTWFVLAFPSTAERNRYLENSSVAARKILRREVTGYLTLANDQPIPFSGDYWAVSDQGLAPELIEKYPGVKAVELASVLGWGNCEHFHKKRN